MTERIFDRIVEASKRLFFIREEYTRNSIIDALHLQTGITESSIIPSDYCYNRTNEGINFDTWPHIFELLDTGSYRYLDENYPYTGIVTHRNKYGQITQFGTWNNGVFTSNYTYDSLENNKKVQERNNAHLPKRRISNKNEKRARFVKDTISEHPRGIERSEAFYLDIDDIEKNNVIQTLLTNFAKSGIKLNSHIDFERFKAKYNPVSAGFVLTEKQFNSLLMNECVIYDDRAYVFSEIEIDGLRTIVEIEESQLIYFKTLYENHESELYDLRIYTVDMLKAVIQRYFPELECRYGRFAKGKSARPVDLITACFRDKHVLTVKEIEAMCPELKTHVIANTLFRRKDEFINVGRGTYTHIDYVKN